jgi:hypothetical protein
MSPGPARFGEDGGKMEAEEGGKDAVERVVTRDGEVRDVAIE